MLGSSVLIYYIRNYPCRCPTDGETDQLKQARYLLGLTLILTLGCGLAQHWDGNQVQEIRLGEVVLDTTW